VNGRYAESNKDPDIVFRLNTKNGQHYFAVECKWRSNFYQGKVEIAMPWFVPHESTFKFHHSEFAIFIYWLMSLKLKHSITGKS